MCATCGCGDAARSAVTAVGDRTSTTTTTTTATGTATSTRTTTATHEPDPERAHPHARARARCWPRTTSWPPRNRALARRARHHRAQPDELAGRGQDHAARAHHRRAGRPRRSRVIEGDQETLLDAERIRGAGAPVVQINTGAGCHLDADMVRPGARRRCDPADGSLLFIENVGNLVCPALFDLGEAAKVVVISVTEGDDKPLKYPHMFAAADLVVVNKIDLLPYVDFDVDRLAARRPHACNPDVRGAAGVGHAPATGLDAWYDWLGLSAGSRRRSA